MFLLLCLLSLAVIFTMRTEYTRMNWLALIKVGFVVSKTDDANDASVFRFSIGVFRTSTCTYTFLVVIRHNSSILRVLPTISRVMKYSFLIGLGTIYRKLDNSSMI